MVKRRLSASRNSNKTRHLGNHHKKQRYSLLTGEKKYIIYLGREDIYCELRLIVT